MPNRKPVSTIPLPFEGEPTPAYYGFYDDGIQRQDWKFSQGIKSGRAIEYVKPGEDVALVKTALQNEGFILGRRVDTSSLKMEQYVIPNSAHPINHDAGSASFSSLRYNDTARFYDMGVILGQIARLTPSTYELKGNIGRNIAEVEFTLQDERRLLLVPGFEHYLAPTTLGHEDLLASYAQRLNDEFGSRFVRHVNPFAEGFDS